MLVRFIASPALPPNALDAIGAAARGRCRVLAAATDSDLNATLVSVGLDHHDVQAALDDIFLPQAAPLSAGRAFRFDVMPPDPASVADEVLRAWAVSLHGGFSAPVFIARRPVPAAAWSLQRPMPWGRMGLSVGQTAPALPFGGSTCLGVAVELGAPVALVKARLTSVPEHALEMLRAAVGGSQSGFAEVGAYACASAADGAPLLVLEFSDVKRCPIHRALTVMDVEAARFGGRLGEVSLRSHVPLDSLLDVLHARTGLVALASQVLETHLPRGGAA
jgi:hypothetical protein